MEEQQLWILIAGKLTGEASNIEMLALRNYLQANKHISNFVDTLASFWQIPVNTDEHMPELAFEKLVKKMQEG